MSRRALVCAMATALAATGEAQAARVPLVGCASNGQLGPQKPPRGGRAPDVPARAAPKLAWYVMYQGLGVLAPRGWRCFGLYGSNGSTLIVAPEPLSWERITGDKGFDGPIVQLSVSFGGTSGRFEVAHVAGRLFPSARTFVDAVAAEGLDDQPYVREPFPDDRITHRGASQALYTTPAGKVGLGTQSKLAPGTLPIDGIELLSRDGEMDLTSLAARLPAPLRPLVAVVIRQVSVKR